MPIGLTVASISILWVLMEGLLAYADGMLTPSQMLARYPTHLQGLPFICHGGMWGDLLFITPIVGIIVALYGDQWSTTQMLVMLGIGMVLSGAIHSVYVMTPFADSLAWKGGISAAGWVHVLYMGVALAIVGLLYFYTANVPPTYLVVVSVLLTAHVAIGNHIVLGWLNELHHWSWCPDFIHKPDPWITIAAVCVILTGLTQWATNDWRSSVMVLLICAAPAFFYYGFKGLARVPH